MCVYCMMADWVNRWVPHPHTPTIPVPVQPFDPVAPYTPGVPPPPEWTREQYEDLTDILRRIKEMEDRLGGCPCEDESKMDFLRAIRDRLDVLEQKVDRDDGDHDGKPIQYGWPEDNEP